MLYYGPINLELCEGRKRKINLISLCFASGEKKNSWDNYGTKIIIEYK